MAGFTLAALTACQPSPVAPVAGMPVVLGRLELGIAQETARLQTVLPDSTGSFAPTGAASVCDNTTTQTRYISRSFKFTNNSAAALTNLTLNAYRQASNLDGTALKGITDFGGQASPYPRGMLPAHGMNCLAQTVDPLRADLQVFDDNMTGDLTTEALAATPPLLSSGEYLLQHGYLVQQRAGDTDSDNDSRTVAPGETGTVTIGLRTSIGSSNAYNFFMTFLLTAGGANELVQSEDDQLTDTVAGLSSLPAGVRKVTFVGGQRCSQTPADLRVVNSYRLAGKPSGTGVDAPLSAPNFAPLPAKVVVTSSADSGPGSLRQAILDAATMTEICFTQDITLSSEITLDKTLLISGGANVSISGNSNTRVFRVLSNGIAVLNGFSVINGSVLSTTPTGTEGGGGIRNEGTLYLYGMKLHDNAVLTAPSPPAIPGAGTPSPSARGGAVYNAGVLQVATSRFWNNNVRGLPGLPATNVLQAGGVGGNAFGGAIFSTASSNTILLRSLVTQNTAQGGPGGQGFPGTIAPTQSGTICLQQPVGGGSGGSASGGGVYVDKPGPLYFPVSITGNTASIGVGGQSLGPPPCNTSQASSGTLGNANLSGP